MSFQAVIRNTNNEIVSKKSISIRISLLQGASNGNIVYSEIQSVFSDFNGLVSLQIGTGNISFGTFADIDWANGPYFIKTEADPTGGYDYSIVGATELLSVPYALFALNTNVDNLIGSCYDWIDLSKLKLRQDITLNITKGLDFRTIGHIKVSDAKKNNFEGLVISYDNIKGILILNITQIVGTVSDNSWTIKIDGSRGYEGFPGKNGTNGTNGLIGLTGAIGLEGAKGLKGDSGVIGRTGLGGTNGINGIDGAKGLKGDSGVIGRTGLSGTNGIDGAKGLKGDSGVIGRTGLSGTNGIDGAKGLKGDSGVIGRTGLSGTNGINGVDGSIGIKGDSGTIGKTGINGTNGINGVDGINGTVISSGTTLQYYRGDKTWQTLNANVVGLEYVNNTSDINKPIPISVQTALDLKSTITSPNFTGVPLVPTANIGINTQQAASTAFVLANSNNYLSTSAGNEISTNSTTDVIATGLSLTAVNSGKYLVNFNSQYTIEPGSRTAQATADLTAAYNYLMAKPITNSSHGVSYGAGETLPPGVYSNAGAVTITGSITLDAGGNPNAQFIFKFGAAFSTGASSNIILANGASACNVFWVAEGAIALGASTIMKGYLISNNGAVSLGSMSNVQGSLYSGGGAIGLDASTLSYPVGCPNDFGSITNFAIFSKIGDISNVGASVISGDIATNSGNVTGFESASRTGVIYGSGINNATTNFSIYQNGTQIPFSSRKRISSNHLGEISLQAIATVGAGENIDIRWNIDSGIVKLQNRSLTLLNVRN